MTISIPASHCDLLRGSTHAVLTTMMPDGTPQSSIVWADYDGDCILVNTTLERQKGRNMRRNPRVTLLVTDPKDASRWIEVRGCVRAITELGAQVHADRLTRRYTGKQCFYGDIYPVAQREKETRVIFKIEPTHVSMDAIFK